MLLKSLAGRSRARLNPLYLAFTDATATIDPRLTFDRASSATYFDSSGVLQTASSWVARAHAFQDHDPSTLTPLGFLIEEQRTNLLLRSAEFDNAAWTKTRSSISANAITSPDGTAVADKLVEDGTAANNHYTFQTFTISTTTTYTWTVFAKAGERTWLGMSAYDGSTNLTFFNLSTGTIGTNGAGNTASIKQLPNGWYRCTITRTTGATTTGALELYLADADNSISYNGNGTSGLYLWGAMAEAGSFATSYIATTTAAATRLADSASITGTAFSSIFNQSAFSVLAKYRRDNSVPSASVLAAPFEFSDGTYNNRVVAFISTTGSNAVDVINGGATQASMVPGAWSASATQKLAVRIQANSFASSANGGTVSADTSGSVPTVDRLTIGAQGAGGGAFGGTIQTLSIYRAALPNAILQSITA